MNYKRKDGKRFNSGQTSPPPDRQKESKGFAGLDPTKIGLDGPDWLASSLAITPTPVALPGPPETEPPSPAASQWPECNGAADMPQARTL